MSETSEFISSPLPIAFWEREVLVGGEGEWFIEKDIPEVLEVLATSDGGPRKPLVIKASLQPITERPCRLSELSAKRKTNAQLDAFLFWSRAPFAERAADGSVLLRDARFYSSPISDRFTVALSDVKCEPIPTRND